MEPGFYFEFAIYICLILNDFEEGECTICKFSCVLAEEKAISIRNIIAILRELNLIYI